MAPASGNRYTAVPGTRRCGWRAMEPMNRSMGSSPRRVRARSSMRPCCHVVITMNTTTAMTSGTQPPLGTLRMLAAKNAKSIARNSIVSPMATRRGQCHRSLITAYRRMVVMTMVEVTATP